MLCLEDTVLFDREGGGALLGEDGYFSWLPIPGQSVPFVKASFGCRGSIRKYTFVLRLCLHLKSITFRGLPERREKQGKDLTNSLTSLNIRKSQDNQSFPLRNSLKKVWTAQSHYWEDWKERFVFIFKIPFLLFLGEIDNKSLKTTGEGKKSR